MLGDDEPLNRSSTVARHSSAGGGRQLSKWVQAPSDGRLQVRYYSASGSATYKGFAVETYEYRRYQASTTPVAITPTWVALRLPGQYFDAETDLFQNHARFYDPLVGRFLGPDQLWLNPSSLVAHGPGVMSLSIYGYAGFNPLTMADPSGNATVIVDHFPVYEAIGGSFGFRTGYDWLERIVGCPVAKCGVESSANFFAAAAARSAQAAGQAAAIAAFRHSRVVAAIQAILSADSSELPEAAGLRDLLTDGQTRFIASYDWTGAQAAGLGGPDNKNTLTSFYLKVDFQRFGDDGSTLVAVPVRNSLPGESLDRVPTIMTTLLSTIAHEAGHSAGWYVDGTSSGRPLGDYFAIQFEAYVLSRAGMPRRYEHVDR